MSNVQFIQFSPQELAKMISEEVSSKLSEKLSELNTTEKEQEGKEFLSRKEVSMYLDVSYSCIHDWMKRGLLTPYKIGNRTFFRFEDIKETLKSSNI